MFYEFAEILENRKQIRWYDQEKIPDKEIIDFALKKTYETVASKQNLMPYKVHVVGPLNKEVNNALYETSTWSGITANYNLITAAYQFIYEVRLAKGSEKVIKDVEINGHIQPPMNPELYKTRGGIKNTNIEIGMHATILSKILIENGLDVSYTLCFENNDNNQSERWNNPNLSFITDEVQFILSAGYPDLERYFESREERPSFNEVVQWV